ncbi:hypothetical protein HYV88_05340 [Candidatus Woesearchaeota archaeon]|nr:hypothetical protein [Candidatus Woesearchaeota archaeon]
MKIDISSESYLPWEEFCKLSDERERLVLMQVTERSSLKDLFLRRLKW